MIVIRPVMREKLSPKFIQLLEQMNRLEENLEYPNCSGYSEQLLVLEQAEKELKARNLL